MYRTIYRTMFHTISCSIYPTIYPTNIFRYQPICQLLVRLIDLPNSAISIAAAMFIRYAPSILDPPPATNSDMMVVAVVAMSN